MFRLWGKIVKNNNIVRDKVVAIDSLGTKLEEKIFAGTEELCHFFDIENPMWLSDNTNDMNKIHTTIFRAHHFIDSMAFDSFEIELLQEHRK